MRVLLWAAALSMLAPGAPATPLMPDEPDLFRLELAPDPALGVMPEFATVDFIFMGIAPPGRETDLALQRALFRLLPGVKRPPGRFRSLARTDSQAFVMAGVALVALGFVRSRRRRYPVRESRRLAA